MRRLNSVGRRVVQSANNPTTFNTLTGATAGKTQTADATGLVLTQGGITFIWDAGAGADTSWFNPINWDLDSGTPGAGDTAILNTAKIITLSGSNAAVATFQLGGGGTLTGVSNLTISSTMTWLGGSMEGTGTTIIAAGATLTLPSLGSVLLAQRTLNNNGTVTLPGAATFFTGTGATINNAGLWNYTGDTGFASGDPTSLR